MPFIFLWVPVGVPIQTARQDFSEVLSRQVDHYIKAFSRKFSFHIQEFNTIFIGQIFTDLGVTGWTPWIKHDSYGVVWSGICENFLGIEPSASTVKKIIETVEQRPHKLLGWDGRFGICTWNEQVNTVCLTTGATSTTSFWYTEGPKGWAVGNQALPILELVGQQPEIDLEAAQLYTDFGFLMNNKSLFKGVSRLNSRRQITITQELKPAIQMYLSLDAFLAVSKKEEDWDTIVSNSADRLLLRVSKQLAHSSNPNLLLTGGRDSRCIAAAVVKAGYKGAARTTGASNSGDVVIASKISQALGLTHHQPSAGEKHRRSLAKMLDAPDRLMLWMRLNEGMESIKHSASNLEFFSEEMSSIEELGQKFHGLGGEIGRGGLGYPEDEDVSRIVDSSKAYDVLLKIYNQRKNKPSSYAQEQLKETLLSLEQETNGMPMTLANWIDLFYWQVRVLHWGTDMMNIRSPYYWCWTPLLDRELIQTAWRLNPEQKVSNKYIEAVTLKLQPTLRGFRYLKMQVKLSPKEVMVKKAKQLIRDFANMTGFLAKLLPLYRSNTYEVDEHLLQFHQDVFFNSNKHIWPDLISKKKMEEALKVPTSDLVWNLSTIELVAKSVNPNRTT